MITPSSGKKYTLTVTADPSWMNAEDRVFPVTVDPSLTVYGSGDIIDTYISQSNAATAFSEYANCIVSALNTMYIRSTALPELPDTAYISNVSLSVTSELLLGSGRVGAYEVTSDWDSTLTYNSYPSDGALGTVVQDYCNITSTGTHTFDITALGRKWYSGTNYGVALKYIDTSVKFSVTVYSANSSSSKPAITVSYVDMGGVESYMPLTSHSAGAAGDGSVNLATGQLTLSVPLLSTTDYLMPVTVGLVYNSALSGKEYVYGNVNTAYSVSYTPLGFRLNIGQTVISKSYTKADGTSATFYTYLDADGTEHAFYASETETGVYYDGDGLRMKLTVNDGGSVEITDPTRQVLKFEKMAATPAPEVTGAWYLSEIRDVSQNSVRITFDSSYRPTKVSLVPKDLSAIDMLTLQYNASGKLDAVYNMTSREAAALRYVSVYNGGITTADAKYLKQIDFANGTSSVSQANWLSFFASTNNRTNITVNEQAYYNYNSSGIIVEARDTATAESMKYEWTGAKAAYLQEYDGYTNGQRIGIAYSDSYTDVQSSGNDDTYGTSDDIKTRYIFDSRGRAVSTYSFSSDGTEVYGAVTGEYETQENAKNNLASETALNNNSPNYLLNGAFKEFNADGSPKYWTVGGNSAVSYGNGCIIVTPVANGSFTLTQYVCLDAGDYTLSFTAESVNSAGLTGTVSVTSQDTANISNTEKIPFEANNLNGISSTSSVVSATFTVTGAREKLKLEVRITATEDGSLADVALRTFMLAEGVGVSDYNLVSLGDFHNASRTANGAINATVSDYWQNEDGAAAVVVNDTDVLFGTVAKVSAADYGESYIRQRIFEITESDITAMRQNEISTNTGTAYTVSGFAKAASAMPSGTGDFAIRVDVYYYQSSTVEDIVKSYYFNFTPGCTDWQFAGGSFTTKYEKSYLDENGYLITEPGSFSWVRAIDVVCDYSYQAEGYALFDRISVCETTSDRVDYSYYSDGMLRAAESFFYSEYYEYNDDNQVTRVANNQGELTDYKYSTKGELYKIINYDFLARGNSLIYPAYAADPDSQITKTAKTQTVYGYNLYGLMVNEQTGYVTETDSGFEFVSGAPQIYRRYTYVTSPKSKIFGAVTEYYVPAVERIKYIYDTSNGRLLAAVDIYSDAGTAYTYDDMGTIISVRPASYVTLTDYYVEETDAESVTYTYDYRNQLSTVTTGSTTYSFTYDVYGNTSSVKAGDSTLAEYTYNNNDGKLNKITYGNGFSEEYIYNEVELLSEIWYTYSDGTKEKVYSYEYTANGELYKFSDHIEDRYTVYRYTGTGKLARMVQYDGEDMEYGLSLYCAYNAQDYLSIARYNLSYNEGTISKAASVSELYSYNGDGSLSEKTVIANGLSADISYTYDDFDRITGTDLDVFGNGTDDASTLTIDYDYTYRTFTDGIGTYTDGYVSTFTSTVNGTTRTYTYEYDSNGNITKITDSGGITVEYEYDNLNQLTCEKGSNGIWVYYTYDNAGNLTVLQFDQVESGLTLDTGLFQYEEFEWGDRFVSTQQSTSTTYDALGNPLTYYTNYIYDYPDHTYTFTWDGRRLATANYLGKSMSYTYNDDGIRTSKTVDGVTTTYHLNGSQIVGEETDTYIILYLYDAAGSPIGMQYREFTYDTGVWDTYFYEKNLQGDIVAIYDTAGTKLATYTYYSYGYGSPRYWNNGGSTGAAKNPFMYRGYYYDSELHLYYLNSRYYDSAIGRFISPDSEAVITATPTALTDKNLYAYCDNNPVTRADYDGEFWNLLIGAGVGALIGAAVSFATQMVEDPSSIGTGEFWAHVGVSAVVGAVSGGLAASGVGLVGQVAGNAILSATGAIADTAIDDKGNTDIGTYFLRAVEGATIGAISGIIGGKGSASKHVSNHFWRMIASGADDLTYYFSQVNRQAIRDGVKAIPSIVRATIPTVAKSILK